MKVKFIYKGMNITVDLKYEKVEVRSLKSNLLENINKEFKNSSEKNNNYEFLKELADVNYSLKFFKENDSKIPVELKDDEKIDNSFQFSLKIVRCFKTNYIESNTSSNKTKIEELIKNVTGAKQELKVQQQNQPKMNMGLNSLFNSLFSNPQLINNQGGIESLLLNQILNNPIRNRPANPINRPQVQPDTNLVNSLIEMGFDEIRSRRALTVTNNNLERAVDILANDDPILDSNLNSQSNISDSSPLININFNNEDGDINDDEEEFDENDPDF